MRNAKKCGHRPEAVCPHFINAPARRTDGAAYQAASSTIKSFAAITMPGFTCT